MNWNDLKLFLELSRSKRVKSAARKLGVNQTTVNRRLSAMQDALGVSLFVSNKGDLLLTDEGEKLREHALRVEAELQQAIDRFAPLDNQLGGVLRLTCADITMALAGKAFERFLSLSPKLSLELVVDNWNLDLQSRKADMAIRATPNPPKSLFRKQLQDIEFAVYGAKGIWSASEPLDQLPFVALADEYSTIPIANWIRRKANNVRVSVNSPLGLLHAVRAAQGVSLLPTVIGDSDDRLEAYSGVIHPLTLDCWFLAHPEVMRYPRAEAMLSIVTEELG